VDRLSPTQWLGVLLSLIVGGYGVALLVDLISDDVIDSIDATSGTVRIWLIVSVVAAGAAAVVALAGLITVLARNRGAATFTAVVLLATAALFVAAEVVLMLTLADNGQGFAERLDSPLRFQFGAAFAYGTIVVSVIAAIALLARRRRDPAMSYPAPPAFETSPGYDVPVDSASTAATPADDQPVPPPPPPAGQSVPTITAPTAYYVQFDGVDYGPFDEATMRGFIAEGRVIASSVVRTADGTYGPADQVTDLF